MSFNFDKLFDMMCHVTDEDKKDSAYTLDMGDAGEVQLDKKQLTKVVGQSIQAFVHTVATGSETRSIQAFSGSSDLPALTKDVFNVTVESNNYDLGWQRAFRGVPLRKGQLEWEIATVSDATQFKLTPEGAKCEISSVSGDTVTAKIEKYSKGLGFTWEMIEGRKLYRFVESLLNMRDKLYGIWALIHYGLLATAAAVNPVAYQGDAADAVVARDAATLNAGAYQIANATKDSGYGDTASARMVIYANPKLRDRIDAALKATRSELAVSGKGGTLTSPVSWNIEAVYTFNSQIPENKGVMVLPGNKIQNSVYLQQLALKEKEIDSLNENTCYWTAFGAIVADNNQCAEISFE